MALLIFLLVAYGMSNIIVYGSIFNGFRDLMDRINPGFFGALFGCMICLPTWVGFVGSALIWSPTEYYGVVKEGLDVFNLFTIDKKVISVFLDGCLTSGAVWLIHSVQEATERHFSH